MIRSLQRRYVAMLTSGAQVTLLFGALHWGNAAGWAVALALIAALSFLAWTGTYRRWRAVADTPTSQIAYAAQGYVELAGDAAQPGAVKIVSRLTQLPCCWYRFRVEVRRNDRRGWSLEDEGESVDAFRLRDASGECTIEPEGAEVVCTRKQTWTSGERRFTEWVILERDPLYVLGELATFSPATGFSEGLALAAKLTDWKSDSAALRRRFDLDGDGEISLAEWRLARAQAKREVAEERELLRAEPSVHVVRRPSDGRAFLLANVDAEKLAARFSLWAWVHLGLFLAGTAGSVLAASRL
jgi:hypothetical protein